MDEIINALRNLKMPGMTHYWATMQETRQAESLSLKDGAYSGGYPFSISGDIRSVPS